MKVGDLVGLIRERRDRDQSQKIGIVFKIHDSGDHADPGIVWAEVLWIYRRREQPRTYTSTRYLEVINESR